MKKLFITTFIILAVIVKISAQTFIDRNLNYSVNDDGATVTLTGFIDRYQDLIIPETVNYEGQDYPVTAIGNRAFWDYWWDQDSLVIPNTVTYIGYSAFTAYPHVNGTIKLSDNLTYIGAGAFNGNGFHGELVIPNTVTYIGDLAFCGCAGVTGDLVIPNSVEYIGIRAFEGCRGLQGSLTISNSIDTIRESAFSNCRFTGELIIPNSVKSIDKQAFWSCAGFSGDLRIPNSVNHIGEEAFFCCTGFDGNFILPDSIADIGQYAFSQCSGLTGPLNIPATLTRIDKYLFAYCGFTGPLIIPDSVTYIGDGAFVECRGFSGDLVIGKSVKYIGLYAFGYCPGITNVVSLSTEPAEAYYNEFEHLDCTTLSVPCGFIQAYYYAGWLRHFTTVNENCNYLTHPEWYYELLNDSGNITYQYLSHQGDTTIQHKKVKIIVKTNTLYDKESIEQTEEYIYVDDNKVFWWNQTIEEFTVLYDFGAQIGDYWEIKAGLNSIVVHVDMVGQAEYDGIVYKTLQISDYDDVFSGTIVCTVGHLTSFFPEKMLDNKGNYEVNGLRCFWDEGELLFKEGDTDCDYVYDNHHYATNEIAAETGFVIYPIPTYSVLYVLFVKTCHGASLQSEYRIINMMGQSVLSGTITSETQQIDISTLPNGLYFLKIHDRFAKFVVEK